jgi:hypothetical protein
MPLLSIGRIPLLHDCNLFLPCALAHTSRMHVRCRAPPNGIAPRAAAQAQLRRLAHRPRGSGLTAHQNGLPCGNPIAQQRHVPRRLYSFARNRMTALQVSPGSPASRSSCVGQRGAHPYRDFKNTTAYPAYANLKAAGNRVPQPSCDRLLADWAQAAFQPPNPAPVKLDAD